MMDANIEGLDNLLKKLDKLSQKKEIAKGLEIASQRVEADAKLNAPINDGLLKSSITHEVDVFNMKAEIGTVIEYAPYVEYGTGIYAASGLGRKDRWSYQDSEGNWHSTIGQHPQPFLHPALNTNKNQILQDIRNAIKKSLGGKT